MLIQRFHIWLFEMIHDVFFIQFFFDFFIVFDSLIFKLSNYLLFYNLCDIHQFIQFFFILFVSIFIVIDISFCFFFNFNDEKKKNCSAVFQ